MKAAPFGSWLSPLSPELITAGAKRLSQPVFDGADVYFLEQRPTEGGRNVVVKRSADGQVADAIPAGFNVRSAVHEYGGGAYIVNSGTIYFSNFADHRIYCKRPGQEPFPVTAAGPFHYADFCFDVAGNRLIVVKEDHSYPGEEALASLDVVDLSRAESGAVVADTLLTGSDFFSSPRLSRDGKLLTWITWSHPNMPWDESKLWTGNVGRDGSLSNMQLVAGGGGESIFQPEWDEDNTLYFVSDRNGFWNLHASYSGLVEPIVEMDADFGLPHWVFGLSTYDVLEKGKLVAACALNGVWSLALVDAENRTFKKLDVPYHDFAYIRASSGRVLCRAGSATKSGQIVLLTLDGSENPKLDVVARPSDIQVDPGYVSEAEPIEFDTTGGAKAYAFYYPPKNADFKGPEGELPPLIVKSHGGPTSAFPGTFDLGVQYWTSRGFGVVEVNYGGSSGYGKNYRTRLNGNWGVVDVDDCEAAALYLSGAGKVDGKRLVISGGSAGGFTTLCALTFKKTFTCGASYYGVSDLTALATDTHKFESRYLDSLVGPYPQQKDLYLERSPVSHPDSLSCPVIFFQGLEDKVVPPSQSELMVSALRRKGIPCAYLTFEGEQHGFRKAETIKRCLEAELYFYCKIFGIEREDFGPPVEISDLSPAGKSR